MDVQSVAYGAVLTLGGLAVGSFLAGRKATREDDDRFALKKEALTVAAADDRYLRKDDFDPETFAARAECVLKHSAVERELESRAKLHHELAGVVQRIDHDARKRDERDARVETLLATMTERLDWVVRRLRGGEEA